MIRVQDKIFVKVEDNYVDLTKIDSRPSITDKYIIMLWDTSIAPNSYLYRYMSLEAFIDMIKTGMNTLTSCYIQEDKYEGGLFAIQHKWKKSTTNMLRKSNLPFIEECIDDSGIYKPYLKQLKNVYIQSWTKKENCEGMWKAYSNSGKTRTVKIKCKAGDLLNGLINGAGRENITKCFLCAVKYMPKAEYISTIESISNGETTLKDKIGASYASDHIIKRDDFEYENEVRLLYLHYLKEENEEAPKGLTINEGKTIKYKIKVNDSDNLLPIHEVIIDPWTKVFYVDSIKDMLGKYGISPDIVKRSDYFDAVL